MAFRALKQGLKFSYDNWRMWNNYMIVALDVGELSEACRALGRVVEERAAKDGAACVDEDVLDRLVDAATRGPEDAGISGGDGGGGAAADARSGDTGDDSDCHFHHHPRDYYYYQDCRPASGGSPCRRGAAWPASRAAPK